MDWPGRGRGECKTYYLIFCTNLARIYKQLQSKVVVDGFGKSALFRKTFVYDN